MVLTEKESLILRRAISNSPQLQNFISALQSKNKVLFLTTSNRYEKHEDDIPKSTQLAYYVSEQLNSCEVIEVPKLKIYPCEGNVSSLKGMNCGNPDSVLKDKKQNPTGYHRCWASFNNKDDELWKVSKPLFESDCVVFFLSVRWGQANSFFQKLIERLSWIEARQQSWEKQAISEIEKISAGLVVIGQNFNGNNVVDLQKKNLEFFKFDTSDPRLFVQWQFINDSTDETVETYQKAIPAFEAEFGFNLVKPKE